jgi:hypothetical protein
MMAQRMSTLSFKKTGNGSKTVSGYRVPGILRRRHP